MDYNKTPLSYDYTKDISRLIPENTGPRHMKILCIQECFHPESCNIPPGSDGCERIFLETFLTDEMCQDFPLIFQEFIRSEHTSLPHYAKDASSFHMPASFSPGRRLQQKLFYLMYAALRQKSSSALCLFRKLYKTYYNQEYQQLKRFHSITYQDVLALADTPQDDDFIAATSRILTASSWLSITQESDCAAVHFALNRHMERRNSREKDSACSDILFQQCHETVLHMTEMLPGNLFGVPELRMYHFLTEITEPVLRFFGCPKSFSVHAKNDLTELQKIFSHTLCILKKKYPKRTFSLEEIQSAAVIYACIQEYCSQLETLNATVDQLISFDISADSTDCRFRPDKQLTASCSPAVKHSPPPQLTPVTACSDEATDKLQLEINSLRIRLEQQERENRHLHALYSESRSSLSKAEASLKQYDNDRQELIALRNHVYHLTEDDTILPASDLTAMAHVIAQKRIIIIGGHSNWIYKLRNRFPSWNFLSPKTSGSVDNRLLKHADYVYFFTSIIKHCTYMRFIRIVRDQNIPFGYIHNINIQSNIQQIYKDISASGS